MSVADRCIQSDDGPCHPVVPDAARRHVFSPARQDAGQTAGPVHANNHLMPQPSPRNRFAANSGLGAHRKGCARTDQPTTTNAGTNERSVSCRLLVSLPGPAFAPSPIHASSDHDRPRKRALRITSPRRRPRVSSPWGRRTSRLRPWGSLCSYLRFLRPSVVRDPVWPSSASKAPAGKKPGLERNSLDLRRKKWTQSIALATKLSWRSRARRKRSTQDK